MADEYETFIHRWFEEVWNQKREDAIDEMFAKDGIANGLNDAEGKPLRGPEGFKTLHRAFLSAYPDLRITVEDTVVEGDKIAARCRVTGSHAGHGIGVAPTNQPVEFTGMTIVHVKDGKIVEAWNEFNFMEMYKQVGALTLNLQ
jgi:predicted ester cyclase